VSESRIEPLIAGPAVERGPRRSIVDLLCSDSIVGGGLYALSEAVASDDRDVADGLTEAVAVVVETPMFNRATRAMVHHGKK
jgi:hypothetical protein